ncbi:MAG: heparan-alpha-glucosaminide N-acetyltransferase domain-containing protein [Agriterribacter sp.]
MQLTETNKTAALIKARITSIDFLRGAIMIIMALDHVRDYFHAQAFYYDPMDLEKTSVWIFFTRWITHYCAPIFMLLSGVSASLMAQRKTKKQLASFLFTRGLWLVILELTVVNVGWNFNLLFPNFLFVTIWALGISMICLAGLIFLPKKIILLIAAAMIVGHNMLDGIHVPGNSLRAFVWALVHDQQFFTWHGKILLVGYPLVPWIGVMALGFCLGDWFAAGYDVSKRKRNLLFTGIVAIVFFFILRLVNVYGDPSRWTTQSTPLYTFLSFLKVTKYPPSLMYILMTLGRRLYFLHSLNIQKEA